MTQEISKNDTPKNSIVEFLKNQTELFHNSIRVAYARIKIGERYELVTVRETLFRQYITKLLFSFSGKIPQQSQIKSIVFLLEIEALEGVDREVFVRIAKIEGDIYLDLANTAGEVVKITKGSWEIIPAHLSPVYFYRPAKMKALPNPKQNGDITRLVEFLNLESDDHLCLVFAWLLMAMNPNGPYPVLCVQGEQGSGKSTAMKILRNVIDPSLPSITSMPNGEENILISALRSQILAFDNISSINSVISDVLCRLATGGGFSKRTLFTDDDETCFNLMRPLMLNGITGLIGRQDLCDRTVFINTIPIPKNERRTEEDLYKAFEEAHPDILGGLCTALATALHNSDSVQLSTLPRMADFAKWITAAEQALPFPPDLFMAAYERNRAEITDEAIEADPVASAVVKLIQQKEHWSGTATDLLQQLNLFITDDIKRLNLWPKHTNSLSRSLKRSVTFLREKGIEISFVKSGVRTINIVSTPQSLPPIVPGTYQE